MKNNLPTAEEFINCEQYWRVTPNQAYPLDLIK
jgi:hypothetical protein